MSSQQSAERRRAIQTQRGRKTQKLGGTHQRFWTSRGIGPRQCDTRPPMARQPKGDYTSVPHTVVDHRPPVCQKPLTEHEGNSQWHSRGRNGTPRQSDVGSSQPYRTSLYGAFSRCRNGTKTMPKSCHFVPNRGILS